MDMQDMDYIGDGVYVGHDEHQLWLTTGSHKNPALLALDQNVLKSLNNYANRIFGKGAEVEAKRDARVAQLEEALRAITGNYEVDTAIINTALLSSSDTWLADHDKAVELKVLEDTAKEFHDNIDHSDCPNPDALNEHLEFAAKHCQRMADERRG